MAAMGAEKRQKNTDDYKDFLASGKSSDAMTGDDEAEKRARAGGDSRVRGKTRSKEACREGRQRVEEVGMCWNPPNSAIHVRVLASPVFFSLLTLAPPTCADKDMENVIFATGAQ